jgi:cysteine synthase
MYFKDNIEALGYTPMVELAHLSPSKRVRILAKMEGQSVGGGWNGSIKDRIAKYMIEPAEKRGELTQDKTVIEATSGNTGIALAWVGRKKGYRVTIVMPDSMSVERRKLLRIFGAELVLTDGALGMNGAVEKARELVAKGRNNLIPDQFNNPANPRAHYETTGVEILEDFPYERISVLVCGIGTSGSICGISRRLKEKYPILR